MKKYFLLYLGLFLVACLFCEGGEATKEEVQQWRKAAEQGNAEAQCNLGVCYMNGTGVDMNQRKAKEWIKKSKEEGSEKAEKIWGFISNQTE